MNTPHDTRAEKTVLGACLIDPEAVHRVRWLVPGDFYERRHGDMWEAMSRLAGQGEAIDPVLLLTQPGDASRFGGTAYLAELVEGTPTSASVEAHAKTVRDLAIRRHLWLVHERVKLLAEREDLTPTEAVEQAAALVMGTLTGTESSHPVSIGTATREVWTSVENMARGNSGPSGVRTGFTALDSATQGMQRGELTLLAARPSVGKSALAMDIAYNASRVGSKTLVCSLEMTRQSLSQRMVSAEAKVDGHRMRSGHMDQVEYSRVARAIESLTALDLWIDDKPRHSIASLHSLCRLHKSRKGLDLVIVDYLQLMQSTAKGNRVEQVTELSQGLKALARTLDVPVLALSQLSRDSDKENRAPRLSDLRDSGSLEQDADVVLLLSRQMTESGPSRDTLVSIAKNRNGPVCSVMLAFNPETTSFRSYVAVAS